LAQRSPNLPASTTTAVSPLRRKFTNAPSIAPVPLAAYCTTSCLVWKSHCSPSRTRLKTCSNSAERWWTIGCAMRSESRSGTGVGPGVSRRIFFTASSRVASREVGAALRCVKPLAHVQTGCGRSPAGLQGEELARLLHRGRLAAHVARHPHRLLDQL